MFLSTNKCEGIGECIKICPTEAIRLINGKAFSCITCGACLKACPNQTIFKNRYGGYIVDRAKCNGCGVCEFTCPVNSIHIEDGMTKGICARCGICVDACPNKSRIDGFELVEEKQENLLKSFNLIIPNLEKQKPIGGSVKRNCVGTDYDKCILCGRCAYYCPTYAIDLDRDKFGTCTKCRICVDVCPADAIDKGVVDHDKCVLCLNCIKHCPNDAITSCNFKVNINKDKDPINGSIITCLNCGLCADNSARGALKQINGKMRYEPSIDFEVLAEIDENSFDNEILDDILDDAFSNKNDDMNLVRELLKSNIEIESINQKSVEGCPVSTLKEDLEEKSLLTGYCVSCGKCVKACDKQEARSFLKVEWDGSITDDCISCGICSELCPKSAITLKKGTIKVDMDKCVLCEICGIHCPVDAIAKTTLAKNCIKSGFNLVDDKLCMNCKLCYRICPEEAIIDKEDLGVAVDNDNCIYCGACRNVCPAKAFVFEREFKKDNETIDSNDT